jgi:hypothetical protein
MTNALTKRDFQRLLARSGPRRAIAHLSITASEKRCGVDSRSRASEASGVPLRDGKNAPPRPSGTRLNIDTIESYESSIVWLLASLRDHAADDRQAE